MAAFLERLAAELRGRDPADLDWVTQDGVRTPPLAPRGAPAPVPHRPPGFRISCVVRADDAAGLAARVLHAFDEGVSLVRLVLRLPPDLAELDAMLEGLPADRLLLTVPDGAGMRRHVEWARGRGDGVRLVPDHTAAVLDATAAQELAYALSHAVWMLRSFLPPDADAAGAPAPVDIARHAALPLLLGPSVPVGIAKVRAARWLWRHVLAAYGVPQEVAAAAPVHVRSSPFAWTRHDPHTNLVRTTLSAFAAVSGGADVVEAAPFDGASDSSSARLALNQLRLLAEESHLGRVSDPAAGADAVEHLTQGIAAEAWRMLRDVERAGGLGERHWSGVWEQDGRGGRMRWRGPAHVAIPVEEASAARRAVLARREQVVVGVTHFADPQHDAEASPAPESFETWQSAAPGLDAAGPARLAEPFEALRDRSAAFARERGGAPEVLLLQFGPTGPRRARAEFAADLFRAAGFAVSDSPAVDDDRAAAAVLAERGPAVAVACSDDASYATFVPPLVQHLRDHPRRPLVIVAGHPPEEAAAWGADGCIHRGMDALAFLTRLQSALAAETPR